MKRKSRGKCDGCTINKFNKSSSLKGKRDKPAFNGKTDERDKALESWLRCMTGGVRDSQHALADGAMIGGESAPG